jgi:hypothetical protein
MIWLSNRRSGGAMMETQGRVDDDSQHDAVVSNLLDLQARLRGDPASLFQARKSHHAVAEPVTPVSVVESDVRVTVTPEPEEAPDAAIAGTEDAEHRIQALQRRLEFLELEIDAYEDAATAEQTPAPKIEPAPVTDLQHSVDVRLRDV